MSTSTFTFSPFLPLPLSSDASSISRAGVYPLSLSLCISHVSKGFMEGEMSLSLLVSCVLAKKAILFIPPPTYLVKTVVVSATSVVTRLRQRQQEKGV